MSLDENGGAPQGGDQQRQDNAGAQAAPDARQGVPSPAEGGGKPAGGDQGGERRTGMDGGGADRPEPAATAQWPDDWREQLAGGDEGLLKQLRRYTSPANYAKAGFEAQTRLRESRGREPLPDNATAEQVAQYRKDNGIPETSDGYKIEPGGGLVFGDADKPMLDAWAKYAHGLNYTPAQVNQGAAFVAQLQESQRVAQVEADRGHQTDFVDSLREEWGREYKQNVQLARNLLDRHGETGLSHALFEARGPDGRKLGDSPALARFLVALARDANPLGVVVPQAGGDVGKAATDELAALRKEMGDPTGPYWKGSEAAAKQERYRVLLTAVEKQKARG